MNTLESRISRLSTRRAQTSLPLWRLLALAVSNVYLSDAYVKRQFALYLKGDGIVRVMTSVMNIGIITSPTPVAAPAGPFEPVLRILPRSLTVAQIGGLLVRSGAHPAFGCNARAFFSGVIPDSLRDWLWLIFRLPITFTGPYFVPLFDWEDIINSLPRTIGRAMS